MSLVDIQRVAIVDDQPQSRKTYGYTVSNADFEPVSVDGPLGTLSDFVREDIRLTADAGLCDYQLNARAYAGFTGAELVAHWYRENFPAVLCTRWEKTQIEAIRPHRRWIPVLLKPNDLNEESLSKGLEQCIKELGGQFSPERRPWRSQIHFLRPDDELEGVYYAELPAWDIREVIRIRSRDLPVALSRRLVPDLRCHALVNLGAREAEDLYICDWEQE